MGEFLAEILLEPALEVLGEIIVDAFCGDTTPTTLEVSKRDQ